MKRIFLVVLVLSGCDNKPAPTVARCVEPTVTMTVLPMYVNGSTVLVPTTMPSCNRYVEEPNPAYAEWVATHHVN